MANHHVPNYVYDALDCIESFLHDRETKSLEPSKRFDRVIPSSRRYYYRKSGALVREGLIELIDRYHSLRTR